MKKYLLSALALPLLFACSSDDLIEEEVISNDQFAGIAKVDATFSLDEGLTTRMDKGSWDPEEGDLWGFAWMGDGTIINNNPADGKAYQNHNLIQTSGIFKPQTSIYVGKYYLYRPYDKTTVSPQAINFESLKNQPLAEGYESSKQPWKDLAKTAINIGDKWTDVTIAGVDLDQDGKIWNKAGIKQSYKIYGAVFSNQTGLDLTYVKNNPTFATATKISGARDIVKTYAAGAEVGAADIYEAKVTLAGASNSFTYAPTAEPNNGDHDGTFWADKSNLNTALEGQDATAGFNFGQEEAITLTPAGGKLSTGNNGSTAWFWFNSLPVNEGNGEATTVITPVFETSYGIVTVMKEYAQGTAAQGTALTVADCAYVLDYYDDSSASKEWIKLVGGENDKSTSTPKEWGIDGNHNTFINQYGNHKGKYKFDVDFSQGVMDGMHIVDDAHLQKLLKFYLASGKTETVSLHLDADSDGEFKISKISIALLQTINAGTTEYVHVHACSAPRSSNTETPSRIVVTQANQDGDLADKTEVPDLEKVFDANTDVILSKNYDWTWGHADKLAIDQYVTSITNEGKLTVTSTNVELSVDTVPLYNADIATTGATINITEVTTVKNPLTNLGTINVGSTSNTTAELRAYGVAITNDATSLTAYGKINNYGVVGVTAGTTPAGTFNNYGLITMKNEGAMTLLTSNEYNYNGAKPFASPFSTTANEENKMGTVVLPNNNPLAIVSVSNKAETGFIKYTWSESTYAHDTRNVKYNTLVISKDIEFTGDKNSITEIQYLEFNGTRTKVVNPTASPKFTSATFKGIIVNAGKSIVIEKTNQIKCTVGAYLGEGAAVYKGGIFNYPDGATTNYLGEWSTDQIVEY